MARKNPTSVVLTKRAQEIKDRLAPALGLKNILSVGLELFDTLEDKEKIKRAAKAKANEKETQPLTQKTLSDVIEIIKKTVEKEKLQPGTIVKVLNKEEQAILDEFRKLAGPEIKSKKKQKA